MNKVILSLSFFLIHLSGFSQMKLGFTAGAQFSSVKIITYNTETRLSFNAGVATRTPLAEGIDFHMQLLVSGKGFKYYDSYGYKNLTRPLYLELPLAVRFKFNSGNETKLFIGAGGYYAFGLGGNKIYYVNGYKETEKINYGNDYSDDLKQSDWGLVFQLGAIFRENYEGHFFYDMGLTRIIPNSTSNSYNRVFGFNLTWYLK